MSPVIVLIIYQMIALVSVAVLTFLILHKMSKYPRIIFFVLYLMFFSVSVYKGVQVKKENTIYNERINSNR